MPSYKNELTAQIISKALKSNLCEKFQFYCEIETLYETLSTMVIQNGSSCEKKIQRKFDRQIYDQLLQESNLIQSGDNFLVKTESFIINTMRGEIALNEKLKSIHRKYLCKQFPEHMQNLEREMSEYQAQRASLNVFDKKDEKLQQKQRILSEIRDQKTLMEEELFNFRLAFIKEDQLKILTKKLQSSRSNPNFKPLKQEFQNQQLSRQKNTQNQDLVFKANKPLANSLSSSRRIVEQTNVILTIIFLLTLMLILCQSVIIIFQKNFFLNLIVFGFIMSMFVRQLYSKIVLKFFMAINAFSLVLDIAFFLLHHFNLLGNTKVSEGLNFNSIQILEGPKIFYSFISIFMCVIMTGKFILLVLFAIEVCKKQSNQKTLNLYCFSFRFKYIEGSISQDILHNALMKSFL